MPGLDAFSAWDIAVIGMMLILGGGVHGLLGFGFPLLATPLIATITDVPTAMLILVFPTMAVNVVSIMESGAWGVSLRRFGPLVICVALGSIVGTRLLIVTQPTPYKLLLAGVLFFYLAIQKRGERGVRLTWIKFRPLTAMIGFGLAGGLLAGTVNAAVPVLIIYALELGLAPVLTVQIFNFCFLAGKLSQALTFAAAGLFSARDIIFVLPATLVAMASLGIGIRLRHRIHTNTYRRWLRRALFAMAVLLTVQFAIGAWQF